MKTTLNTHRSKIEKYFKILEEMNKSMLIFNEQYKIIMK